MAIKEVQKFRVEALPSLEERVHGAEYWIRNQTTGELEIHTVGFDDQAVVARTLTRADVQTMVDEAALDDINDFGEGVQTKAFFKPVVNRQGLTVGGQDTLLDADLPNNISGSKIASDITVNTSGNAATATALATGRTIAGKTFDGTQNVDLVASDVGAVATAAIGVSVAPLVNGLVPAANLPNYVDDVIEVNAVDELPGNVNADPANGEPSKGKLYLVVATTNEGLPNETTTTTVYRWGGSVYVQIIDGVSMADQAVRLVDARSITATGDGAWTVSFDGSENVSADFTLAATGVTAGDYGFLQVDAKGRLLNVRALEIEDLPTGITYANVQSAASIAVVDPAW